MAAHQRKVCRGCGVEKGLGSYYRHKQMADGHLNKCKVCVKADVYANREVKADFYRERGRILRAATREKRAAYEKAYAQTERGREAKRQTSIAYRVCHPERRRVTEFVANAIRRGRIQRQPCEKCGVEKAQAHVASRKPLRIRWLCAPHRIEHLTVRDNA